MHNNGTAQHSAQATLTVLGTPPAVLGTPAEALGTSAEISGASLTVLGGPAEVLGGPATVLGTPQQAKATPARRQMAVFGVNHSIARRLAAAHLAINAVLANDHLQATLSQCGYGVKRLSEGRALYEQALALQQQQRARYGDLYGAADARTSASAQAQRIYKQHLVIARVVLRGDRGAAQKLGLHTPRQTTQAGWLMVAQQFYANALSDQKILDALATYDLVEAQLVAGQAQVAAVASSTVMQQATRGAAQAATHARDTALLALNRWMQDFLAIAQSALADQPQWLEQLGLAAR